VIDSVQVLRPVHGAQREEEKEEEEEENEGEQKYADE
jgi:hypothetical protein